MRALVLLSGGFDSAVAAHLMQQKGVGLVGVHFSYEPVTDDSPERKVREVCRLLEIKNLRVIKAGAVFAEIASKCAHRYYYVLAKRLMMRYAEQIARAEGCSFLVTGENLAQVSSQTLENLAVIDHAAGLVVVRPLLCFDKVEILALARKIGTYEASKGPEVCDCLGPKYPATRSTTTIIHGEEEKLDMQGLLGRMQSGEVSF